MVTSEVFISHISYSLFTLYHYFSLSRFVVFIFSQYASYEHKLLHRRTVDVGFLRDTKRCRRGIEAGTITFLFLGRFYISFIFLEEAEHVHIW